MPSFKPSRHFLFAPTVLPLLLAVMGGPALAADRYWTFTTGCGSADWFGRTPGAVVAGQPNCWAASAGGASGVPLPTLDDLVYIQHAHASLDLMNTFSNRAGLAPQAVALNLTLTGTAGRFAGLAVGSDSLYVDSYLTLGLDGKGQLVQSGGSVNADLLFLGARPGDTGVYRLSAGSLTVKRSIFGSGVIVGANGHGEFVQTGGTLDTGSLLVGEPGLERGDSRASSAVLSAGSATVSRVAVGSFIRADGPSNGPLPGAGRLNVSGNASLTATLLEISRLGTVQIAGGTLTVTRLSLDLAGAPVALQEGLIFTNGVLAFADWASFTTETDAPLPLSFGAGFGSGNPTVRLLSNATLTLPQVDVGVFGAGRLEIGAGAKLNTTTASLGKGAVLGPGAGHATVAGAGALWHNSGALVVGGVSGPGSQLTLTDGGRLVNGGTLTLRSGSSIYSLGGSLSAGKVVSAGTINLEQGGSHTFGELDLQAGSRLLVNSGLTVSGAVNVAAGVRIENTNFLRFEGPVALDAGAVITGDGTKVFAFSLKISGNNPGVFTDLSSDALVLLTASNTYFADIGSGGNFDRYVINGQLVLGGTLKLVGWEGYNGQTGDRFDLFDADLSGSFASIDTTGFSLKPGLSWDFSQLSSTGVVAITGEPAPIPEPGTWALWLGGLAVLGGLARRRQPRA